MKNHHSKWIIFLIALFITLLSTNAFAQNERPRLGLSVSPLQVSPLLLQHLRLAEGEGLMVSNIVAGGELEAEGLSQGDIVLAIDGHALSRPSEITSYVATLPPKTQVTLDVIQKGEHRQIYLTLDNLPDEIVWKYAQPVSRPGRSQLGSGGQSFAVPSTPQINAQPRGTGSSISISKSILSTKDGIKDSTVIINGPTDDPNSEIEITIGQDNYKATIAEIDKLPEEAQKAAQQAIQQSGNFSFSFGGSFGGNIFEEMMQQQKEHQRMMDEMFKQMFDEDPMQQQMVPEQKKEPVLKPVEPSQGDIRS
jgi:guanyl-specific ribonuclease Sa